MLNAMLVWSIDILMIFKTSEYLDKLNKELNK